MSADWRQAWIDRINLTDRQIEAWDYFRQWQERNSKLFPSWPRNYSCLSRVDKIGPPFTTLTWNIGRERSCWKKFPRGPRIASRLCKRVCYVDNMLQRCSTLRDKFRRNDEICREKHFPMIFVGAVIDWHTLDDMLRCGVDPGSTLQIIRVHSSGDFFSEQYTRHFIEIALMLPRVTFLAYTRAWRRPELIPALTELAAVDNWRLHLSYDKDTGAPARIPRTWTSPLLDKNDQPPPLLEHDCVAFRSKAPAELDFWRGKANKLEWVSDGRRKTRVCLLEDAWSVHIANCTKCRVCLRTPPV